MVDEPLARALDPLETTEQACEPVGMSADRRGRGRELTGSTVGEAIATYAGTEFERAAEQVGSVRYRT